MARVLLVANKTLGSGEVADFVRNRMSSDDCEFTLLVPAARRRGGEPSSTAADGLTSALGGGSFHHTEDDYAHARERLDYGVQLLRLLGATVDGEVGDPNPLKAIFDVLQRRRFDEVALSTLPEGISRWLGLDIPHKVERRFHTPVTVIRVQREAPTP